MKLNFLKLAALSLFLIFGLTSCVKEIYQSNNGGPMITGNKEITSISRPIDSNFTQIKKSGFIDVIIVGAEQDGIIEINGESNLLEYIETRIEDSTLFIETKKNTSIRAHKPIIVKVKAQHISNLVSVGSGDISTEGKLLTQHLKIEQKGSTDLKIEVEAESLNLKMSGSGDIHLNGKARQIQVEKSGSGDLYGYQFNVDQAEISSAGSGDAKINVNHELQIQKSGSGDVYYKGNPKIKAKSSGSGDVIKATN